MKIRLVVAILLCAGPAVALEPIDRSVSPSRQFIIFGGETALRGAISDTVETVKRTWLTVMRESDYWKTPIVVYLQFAQANVPELPPSKLNVSQTGAGLKLQLDLLITADIDPDRIRRELLRAIVLERMYRNRRDLPAGTPYVAPPDWLVEAVLAAAPGSNRTEFAGLTNPDISLEQFLRFKPELLDSGARRVYRAAAVALLQVMVDGSSRLNRYVDGLPDSSSDPLNDLVVQFGTFSAEDIQRMWRGAFVSLTTGQPKFLTFTETENSLVTLLKLPSGQSLAAIARAPKISAEQRNELHELAEHLLLLSANAHPLARAIVRQYEEITAKLAAGKTHGTLERLNRTEATRRRLVGRMGDIDDYLNWFEATQSQTRSGMFTEYLRAATRTDSATPHRRDPMSIYLDALEAETQQ